MAKPRAPSLLILSQGSGEDTTCIVMEYLMQLGIPLLRLNGSDFESSSDFSILLRQGEVEIESEARGKDLGLVRVVWFRRWQERQPFQGINLLKGHAQESFMVSQSIALHLRQELRRIHTLLFSELDDATWVSHPYTVNPNKLEVLKLAAQAGMETPATLVTTSKKRLQEFLSHHSVITKPISDAQRFRLDNSLHLMYTQEVDEDLLRSLPDRFFPSLFQEKLDKKYEVRVFYLDGKCYSSAIFSQLDNKTKIDFRQYNDERPNRVVPYRLPIVVENNICSLMRQLDLETGSLDLIKTPDERFVFLEVNPIGQFGMISSCCNYHLERKVAEFLAEKVKNATSTEFLRFTHGTGKGVSPSRLSHDEYF